ncbi:glycosyltransferase [Candidatus Saccharibacteria bacterium]|nr:glycosyltransferase [Candidatus Saccharibacteria bacterium]MBR3138924.1 glycosyltransferase [Candidatus Saccharibacteria bacterium]
MKCDVIIPVYKAPEWVKLCVYSLFANTSQDILNKVYLINDCNDPTTINCLKNLKTKYGNKIIVKQNAQNLGFVKTVNCGLELSNADYILLLNSDCLLAKNTIEKLINHLKKDPTIGLICPLASNAANITIPIPEGWNYTQIDALLEKNFLGKNFDACTIVGNCLMITRKCLEKVGKLDEAYGMGYGEETDYQFKAMAKGFTAKVAIDTYVFHKAEASFGNTQEKQARLQKNRNLFFSRWDKQYKTELKKYKKADPIKYIYSHLPKSAWQPQADSLFYIDGIVQNAGGVHIIVDIVNYLTIQGQSINIVYNLKYPYQEILLFNPISVEKISTINSKQIISTVWKTAFNARIIANQKNINLLSFVQGYEAYFENGIKYGAVELSYKLSNSIFTISKYLQKELKDVFKKDSTVIPNGINYDLLHYDLPSNKKVPDTTTITIIMRNNVMKGDWLLIDLIKKLENLNQNININLVTIDNKILLPSLSSEKITINLYKGPQNRSTIYQLLQESNIYVDASLSEGFGLTALEAMAANCVPIVSDSLGVKEYIDNNQNGIVIKDVNNTDSYISAIKHIIEQPDFANSLIENGRKTAQKYDFDNQISKYINYLNNPKLESIPNNFSSYEQNILSSMQKEYDRHAKNIRAFSTFKKLLPKSMRNIGIKVINKLYNYLNR